MSKRFSPPLTGAGPYRRTKEPKNLLAGGPGEFRLLHSGGQGQGLRYFRTGEGSGCCPPWKRRLLWRGLSERPASAPGDSRGDDKCLIMRLDKAAIVRVLHDEPKFSEVFMSYLLARNARVEEDLVDQLFNSSEKRLARAASPDGKFRQGGKTRAGHSENQPRDARRDGRHHKVARERFHEQISQLGFIEYNGHLEVHNSLLNVVLHDTPEIRRGADSGK